MKKQTFVLATGSLAALATGAQAADLPMKAAPMVSVPAANWTGLYFGLHGGAAWQQAQMADTYTGLPGASSSGRGFIGGGQLGYNWQTGNAVFGLEVDGSGLSGSSQIANSGYGYNGNTVGTTTSKIDWLSTVRGRMGLAVGNAMAYATGGVAFGGVKTSVALDNGLGVETKKTHTGWVVGAGVEQKIAHNWTVGLEGLFVDLGKSTNSGYPAGKVATMSVTTRNQAFIGRFRANYNF